MEWTNDSTISRIGSSRCRLVAVCFFVAFLTLTCRAQELQPRRWSHLPIDTNFLGGGYVFTRADIAFDPVLLLDDVESELSTIPLKYIRTFELLGKSARVDLAQAYQDGQWSGLIDGVPIRTTRHGWSDTLLRFAVNLIGTPPLAGKEFGEYRASSMSESILGVALEVQLPTGQYFNDKLINLGTNRFTFRPQLGVVHQEGPWSVEMTVSSWFYTDNEEFFNGNQLKQDPLHTVQGIIDYTFQPGLWVGTGFAYGAGGKSTVNGIQKDDPRDSLIWGLALGYPISKQIGGQLTYLSRRTQTPVGVDSDSLAAGFSVLW
ncbi:transporter [Novipirellula artificiosorum]|uniref:MetA-pathway of phenol degradation n=1 Tax=Novipirellula artificiosorum TaxID=2528016 RepID=A0A5C6D571_9BACT|nr:transporter [Novipirellula artificiosorum]TWU30827.1 hypothetical protein Poly41_65210 [Novipirellula artificiosorum]